MDIFHQVELDEIRTGVAEILKALIALDSKITIYQKKGEQFMSTASQALIDLQNAVNTLVAGQTNLAAGIAQLQTADANIDAAIATLESQLSGQNGVSAADVEAVVAQLKTASTALASANSSVGTVVTDLNTQVSKAQSSGSGITVVVTPATAALGQGATQQFAASGDPAGYIWSLNPASGQGTIDQTGLYTAPTGQDGSVQVIATSKTDSTKAAAAAVTFAAANATAVAVTPSSATVAQGNTQQFTAVVTGDSSNAVTWSLTPATGAGTLDQTGLYTPPTTPGGSAQVTATSKANPAIFANASVTY